MRSCRKIYLLAVVTAIMFSCSHKKEIAIYFTGELSFRRSFSNIQFMKDEKEIDKYIEEQEKSNPLLLDPSYDSLLKERLEKAGVVKKKEFLIDSFKYLTDNPFHFTDNSGTEINGRFEIVPGKNDKKIIVSFAKDSAQIELNNYESLQDLRYAFLDIVPGGNKEIVLLNQWYIMNGYNFDLMVYEIKT